MVLGSGAQGLVVSDGETAIKIQPLHNEFLVMAAVKEMKAISALKDNKCIFLPQRTVVVYASPEEVLGNKLGAPGQLCDLHFFAGYNLPRLMVFQWMDSLDGVNLGDMIWQVQTAKRLASSSLSSLSLPSLNLTFLPMCR